MTYRQDNTDDRWHSLDMRDRDAWQFVGGPWLQDGDLVSPPREQRLKGERAYVDGRSANVDDYLAFYQGGDYGDFEAEFDFRWDAGRSGSGFIFRAQDTPPLLSGAHPRQRPGYTCRAFLGVHLRG